MVLRRIAILLAVGSIVAAFVIPSATASQYRGRYQLRLDQATTVLAPAAPAR
jgi:hypothetical protein